MMQDFDSRWLLEQRSGCHAEFACKYQKPAPWGAGGALGMNNKGRIQLGPGEIMIIFFIIAIGIYLATTNCAEVGVGDVPHGRGEQDVPSAHNIIHFDPMDGKWLTVLT